MNYEKIRYYTEMIERCDSLIGAKSMLNEHKSSFLPAELNLLKDIAYKKFPSQQNVSSKPICWDWFEEEEIPPFDYVIRDLGLCPGPISILSAFSNTGKTFFAANLGICVANAKPLFGCVPIQNPGKVLHIDWDQGQKFSKIYYWRLLNGHGLKSFKNIDYFKPEWFLDNDDIEKVMTELLSGYKLCIIDCLGSAIPMADINDDRVRAHIDRLNNISEETGCAILLIHHEPKNTGKDPLKSIKGNGSIISAAGGSIHLTKEIGGKEITVTLGKKRLLKDFTISYTLDDCGEYSEKLGTEVGLLLKALGAPERVQKKRDMKMELLQFINDNPNANSRAVRAGIEGRDEEIDKIVNILHEENLITIKGLKPKLHNITDAGIVRLEWSKE